MPADQRAYVDKIIQRLQLCRDPDGGYALYICPGCQYELRVPRLGRPAKLDSVLPVASSVWTALRGYYPRVPCLGRVRPSTAFWAALPGQSGSAEAATHPRRGPNRVKSNVNQTESDR